MAVCDRRRVRRRRARCQLAATAIIPHYPRVLKEQAAASPTLSSNFFRKQDVKEETVANLNRIGIAFALGAMGLAATTQAVTILLLRFLTDSLAVSAAIASLLIAAAHCYDALIDPVVGHASDRSPTRWGRRRPYLLAGALWMPIALIALFHIPGALGAGALIAYLAVGLLVLATASSMFKVPYAALSVEVCSNYHERSRIMAYRVFGGSIGLMLGSTVPAWMLASSGAHRAAYGDMARAMAVIVALCCLVGTLLMPKEDAGVTAPARHTLRQYARIAWDNVPFRIACAAHACFMVGVASAASSNAYFTRYVLGASDSWLGAFYIIMVVASLVSVPIWLKATLRFDKKPTYLFALAFYGLTHLSWLLSGPDEPLELRCLRVLLIGVATGGVMLLAYSITADVIHYDAVRSGQRREGALCGIQSVIDRAFSVVGVASIGVLLTAFGYLASDDTTVSVQPDSAIAGIYIAFAVVPAISCLISMAILSKYDLTAEMLREDASAD